MPQLDVISQIRLLMWKTFLEKKRSKLAIATQAIVPLAMVLMLIVIYQLLLGKNYNGVLEFMFMPFGLIVTIPALTTTIVAEKSTRLLESMKMMGLSETAYWMNIVIVEGLIYGTILGFLVACGAKVPNIWDSDNGLFGNAGFGYVWLCTSGYMISSVPFAFFMSVFFDKPKTAGQISFLLVLASIVFGFAYNMTKQGKAATLLVACLPPYAYELMVDRLRPSCGDACEGGVTFWALFLVMCLSSIGFSVLAWYFRQVMPSEFGIRKHVLFFLEPSYWCSSSSKVYSDTTRSLVKHDSMRNAVELHSSKCDDDDDDDGDLEAPQNSKDFERVPSNLKSTIQIRGLRKTFYGGDGKIVAVNDLTLDMHEDNLFVLLGHNGAGKTTTINMLTGLFPPDTGSSETNVYGKSISQEMDSVRNFLGVCPQHDVLIPSLTSHEHCIFFSMLKGSNFKSAEAEATKLLTDFHLIKRKDHFGHMLSGGMRRKLSTILALCGGSKFVILDEPSTGLDPLARRQLWDSLKNVKKGRTILLTTHYMDEADELGDRIGIMDHGKCACIGTSAFLKRRYGCGYVLECEMKDENVDPSSAVKFVTSKIKGAEFNARESYALQLVFTLPFDAVSEFGAFFNELDKSLSDLGLSEYGVSVTSMEDVFLQVGREGRKKRAGSLAVQKEEESKMEDEVRFGVENQQRASLNTQILVMIRKRLWTARNDYRTIFMLVIPCLVILAFFTLNHQGLLSEEKKVGNGMTSYFSMLAFMFLPGLVAAELIRERSTKLRYTLTVMGCRQYAYFGGMFLGDYIGWMIITVLNWITIISLSGDDYLLDGGVLVLFPFFGIQLLGFSYMISFWFSQPSYAVVATPGILILQLVLSQVLVGIIQLIVVEGAGVDVDDDTNLGLFIWSVTLLCPLGSLGTGLFMCTFDINDVPAGAFPPLPAVMAIMLFEGALFMYRAIILDARNTKDLIARFLDKKEISEFREKMHQDVLKEAQAVDGTDPKSIALQIKQLRKVYPKKGKTPRTVAVKSASMQVRKREILCLLGPNGAGKSTTLNMLLRSCNPTRGDAFILGHSVLNDFEAGAISLGVVPQDNNLWPLLSCKQHLQLFAELRGVPHKKVQGVLDSALKHMELQEKSDTLSSHLSGGMQRRLCTAIALIGEPDVILLDEPSAGLDPVSRRNLWDVIRETMSNRAVILTTHSMEEAEALASRIAILVQGQLQCIGTPTHLKKTLGQDFEIVIRLKDVMKQLGEGKNIKYQVPDKINDFMSKTFEEVKLMEATGNTVVFDVKREHVNMGHAFTTFEANRDDLEILDYQISQPTLEQVFIRTVLDATPVSEDQKVTTLGARVVRRRSGSISTNRSSRSLKKIADEVTVTVVK